MGPDFGTRYVSVVSNFIRGMKNKTKITCTIYHNPHCSKSRATLALLRENGIEPNVVEYLKTPPSATELKSILKKLNMRPDELIRKGEDLYRDSLSVKKLSDEQLIATMVDNPVLIERPIVVLGDRAEIGRPPENILPLLK
jgi:arsenate reductase (glutaredoxin)